MNEDGELVDAFGVVRVRREKGKIYVDTPSASVTFNERQARWLAITALPAMLPGIKTAAQQADERANRDRT